MRSRCSALSSFSDSSIASDSHYDQIAFFPGGTKDRFTGQMSVFAWIVITDGKLEGKGRSGTFFLPPKVAELVTKARPNAHMFGYDE